MLKGIAASPGYGAGSALVLRPRCVAPGRQSIGADQVECEQERLEVALERAGQQLRALEAKAEKELGAEKAQVFAAHQLMLQDPEFAGAIRTMIDTELVTAETAVSEVTDRFTAVFEALEDQYLRERADDVRDVGRRVTNILTGAGGPDWASITKPVVVIAHDLTPSDTLQIDRSKVRAFATATGGTTSHSAIMARTLEIPAVVGVPGLLEAVEDGQYVMVDGEAGTVAVAPEEAARVAFEARHREYRTMRERLQRYRTMASVTPDGRHVEVAANIGRPEDLTRALHNGAEGIGLFRTEFLYMDRTEVPSEEEQYRAYRRVAEAMDGRPVVIRTLDIGGDKDVPYLGLPKELNPFLGYRAIRLCLDRPELFRPQLRAILRASAHGNVRLMLPMVATLGELRQARTLLDQARAELSREGLAYSPTMQVGIMVETPAAAVMAPVLAPHVDFFSIGTNDLTQYTMACDRLNERISYLYQTLDPAVLQLIRMVIEAGHAAGKWVGMCGEMAGDPLAIPVLLGLGLDEFSMNAGSVLRAREVITQTSFQLAKEVAEQALAKETVDEVRSFLTEVTSKMGGDNG